MHVLRLWRRRVPRVLRTVIAIVIFLMLIALMSPPDAAREREKSSFSFKRSVQSYFRAEKQVLFWTDFFYAKPNFPTGGALFQHCRQSACSLTYDKAELPYSAAAIFHLRDLLNRSDLPDHHAPWQHWVFYTLENPTLSYYLKDYSKAYFGYSLNPRLFDNVFNRSATYNSKSDFVQPYGHCRKKTTRELGKGKGEHVPSNKTHMILWYVSNCRYVPSGRMEYFRQLRRFLGIDIYGVCGLNDPCRAQIDGRERTEDEYDTCRNTMVRQYKFYLAFENTRCSEYVTEKFWNALDWTAVPIVLGDTMEYYKKVAPPDSFLHVDNFTSPQALAEYVFYLHQNPAAYAKYHVWRKSHVCFSDLDPWPQLGSHWLCQLCNFLHDEKRSRERKTYAMSQWWSGKNFCQFPRLW